MSIYDYSFTDNENNLIKMSDYIGKTLLIVNVASKCGWTMQYEEIEETYKRFQTSGFEVIGFPCNQFGEQEPENDEEIKNFCKTRYGVSFKISKKIEVNGENSHPIYSFLKENGKNGNNIDWNFEKFLILKDGSIMNFPPETWPHSFADIIQKDLGL